MAAKIQRREFLQCAAATGALTGAATLTPLAAGAAAAVPDATRIEILKRRVTGMPPRKVCFQRARLMTQSYRETEGQAAVLRRAKAFYAVVDAMPIQIDDAELVVGNLSPGPRVAYFAPESHAWRNYRPSRQQVLEDSRFSEDLAIRFYIPDDIAEYWRDKPQGGTAGHFVADYQRVLQRGFRGIRREIEACREDFRRRGSLDPSKSAFCEATQIACDAAVRFAERHGEAARQLAGRTADPTRKRELEQIAAIAASSSASCGVAR